MRDWYLVYSKPRQEQVAALNLRRQGYECYLPMLKARRRRNGCATWVEEPMFPRYLFIRLSDESDNWAPVRCTKGVSALVRFGTKAAKVPGDLIDMLVATQTPDGFQSREPTPFQEGQRVRVVQGLLEGYEAIVSARTGKQRVVVLFEMTRNSSGVEMDALDVQPIQA